MSFKDYYKLADHIKDALMELLIDKQIIEMQKTKVLPIDFALSLTGKMKLKTHLAALSSSTVKRGIFGMVDLEVIADILEMKSEMLITGFCIGYLHKEKETILP